MNHTAQNNYLERAFSRSCLESSPRPIAPYHEPFSQAMHSSNRKQSHLRQLKQKLPHAISKDGRSQAARKFFAPSAYGRRVS